MHAIPQLAPEPDEKGRYCVAYRDWSGTARRLRLTREKGKSQQILNGLVPVYYDPVKGFNPPTSLRAIAKGIRPSLPQHEASLPASQVFWRSVQTHTVRRALRRDGVRRHDAGVQSRVRHTQDQQAPSHGRHDAGSAQSSLAAEPTSVA